MASPDISSCRPGIPGQNENEQRACGKNRSRQIFPVIRLGNTTASKQKKLKPTLHYLHGRRRHRYTHERIFYPRSRKTLSAYLLTALKCPSVHTPRNHICLSADSPTCRQARL